MTRAPVFGNALFCIKKTILGKSTNHLEQANGNGHGNTGTALRTLIVINGPRITLQLFQQRGKREFALPNGLQETAGGSASQSCYDATNR
jgi:hypothetical protein